MGTVLSGLQRVRPVVRFGNALSGPGCGGRMQSALPPLRTITRALPCSSVVGSWGFILKENSGRVSAQDGRLRGGPRRARRGPALGVAGEP